MAFELSNISYLYLFIYLLSITVVVIYINQKFILNKYEKFTDPPTKTETSLDNCDDTLIARLEVVTSKLESIVNKVSKNDKELFQIDSNSKDIENNSEDSEDSEDSEEPEDSKKTEIKKNKIDNKLPKISDTEITDNVKEEFINAYDSYSYDGNFMKFN